MGSFVLIAALAAFVAGTYQAIRSLGPRRGVVAALVGGWLFLPVFDGHLAVPFLSSKMAFTSTVILIVSAALDPGRYARIRFHWVDLVAAAVWFSPFVTALANDLGPYEGLSASVAALTCWGSPYLLGRAYLGSAAGARDFAIALVVGALVYVPFCLWEIRMSPQLHRQIYGYATFENFAFAVRFGGYRPTVFMQFGLMVGTFMASGAVASYWLWRTGALRALRGISMGWWTLLLVATTVLVKSTGAVILMFVGIALLELVRRTGRRLPLVILAVLPLAFTGARVAGWSGHEIAQLASLINTEREQSVAFRLMQEERLVAKAMQRPTLGWGRFGRSRVYDEDGNDISVTDSLWVIVLGTSGVVGLSAFDLTFVLPALLLLRRHPGRRWRGPELAPAAALAVVTVLWVLDCLLNAMTSPLFPAMCGSIVTFVATRWPRRAPAPGRPPPAPQVPPELRVS